MRNLPETLLAKWAAERLFSTVGAKVSSEVAGQSEGLIHVFLVYRLFVI